MNGRPVGAASSSGWAGAGTGDRLDWIRRLEDWTPLVLFTGLLAAVSTISTLTPPGGGPFSDKVWHLGEYAVWAILFRRAIDGSRAGTTHRPLKWAVTWAVGCLVAVADENVQRLAGRHYAVADMQADAAGLVLGLLMYEFIAYRVRLARGETTPGPTDPSQGGASR